MFGKWLFLDLFFASIFQVLLHSLPLQLEGKGNCIKNFQIL